MRSFSATLPSRRHRERLWLRTKRITKKQKQRQLEKKAGATDKATILFHKGTGQKGTEKRAQVAKKNQGRRERARNRGRRSFGDRRKKKKNLSQRTSSGG